MEATPIRKSLDGLQKCWWEHEQNAFDFWTKGGGIQCEPRAHCLACNQASGCCPPLHPATVQPSGRGRRQANPVVASKRQQTERFSTPNLKSRGCNRRGRLRRDPLEPPTMHHAPLYLQKITKGGNCNHTGRAGYFWRLHEPGTVPLAPGGDVVQAY
jgi:hypothetical protein